MMPNIIIIANCRLGDSLVLLPTLKLLRQTYPKGHITFISEVARHGIVAAKDILGNRGLIDTFVEMQSHPNKLIRVIQRIKWIMAMRSTTWDLGLVLTPASPPTTPQYIAHLSRYLHLCGAKMILMPHYVLAFQKDREGNLCPMPHVIDQLLEILRPLGIPLPPPLHADNSLPPLETTPAYHFTLAPQKKYLAVCPGTNIPVKKWPIDNYVHTLLSLAQRHDFIPLYIGGSEDAESCEILHKQLPGLLITDYPLWEVENAMKHCIGYLGNDTGISHLAAALGLPCVTLYSNRDAPGLWEPYIARKAVIRPPACPCSGCLLQTCDQSEGECIKKIPIDRVVDMCETILFNQEPANE